MGWYLLSNRLCLEHIITYFRCVHESFYVYLDWFSLTRDHWSHGCYHFYLQMIYTFAGGQRLLLNRTTWNVYYSMENQCQMATWCLSNCVYFGLIARFKKLNMTIKRLWTTCNQFQRWSGYIGMLKFRPFLPCVLKKISGNPKFDLFH